MRSELSPWQWSMEPACRGHASTPYGEGAVCDVEYAPRARRNRYQVEWCRPPQLSHHVPIGVGADDLPAVGEQQADIPQQLVRSQVRALDDPRLLQSGDTESEALRRRTLAV